MRIPKKGDRVFARGIRGTFIVSEVDVEGRRADLKLIGKAEHYERVILWRVLTYADQDDASQAAARVVREATEDQ
jgi:hypothetical protein